MDAIGLNYLKSINPLLETMLMQAKLRRRKKKKIQDLRTFIQNLT